MLYHPELLIRRPSGVGRQDTAELRIAQSILAMLPRGITALQLGLRKRFQKEREKKYIAIVK